MKTDQETQLARVQTLRDPTLRRQLLINRNFTQWTNPHKQLWTTDNLLMIRKALMKIL